MSKIKVKQADGSIALLPLKGISKAEADKILGDAKEYADGKIEELRKEIPTGGGSCDCTEEIAQAITEANAYADEAVSALREDLKNTLPTAIRTQNGEDLRFFVGTKDDYDVLESKNGIFAIITDDTTKEELFSRIEALEQGGTTAPELNLKIDMPPFFSGERAFPAEKGIYVISFENRTLTLFVPEPVGPGSLQYSTEFTNDDGVTYRLKYFNGILYVQKRQDGGDFEQDNDYNEDFRYMKLASAHE